MHVTDPGFFTFELILGLQILLLACIDDLFLGVSFNVVAKLITFESADVLV